MQISDAESFYQQRDLSGCGFLRDLKRRFAERNGLRHFATEGVQIRDDRVHLRERFWVGIRALEIRLELRGEFGYRLRARGAAFFNIVLPAGRFREAAE